MRGKIILSGLMFFLVHLDGASNELREPVYGNYELGDCIAALALESPEAETPERRQTILNVVLVGIMDVQVEDQLNKFPLFESAILYREKKIFFFFADRCESRLSIINEIIRSETFLNAVPDYSSYGFNLGEETLRSLIESGAGIPSGLWKTTNH